MKPIKKLKYGTICLLLLFSMAVACDSLTDYNENPNVPSDVPASIIIPRAMQSAMDRLYSMSGLNGYIGAIWTQQYAKIQYTDEDRYDFSGRITLVNNIWNDFYTNTLTDLRQIESQAQAGEFADEAKNNNQEAVAKILMAWNYQTMTDVWGPLPFSEALKGADENDKVLSPAYDSQEAIYDGAVAMLDEAISLINVNGPSPFGQEDLIYSGNMSNWLKLAHSLKLRLYMRQSEVAASKAAAGIQAVYNAGGYFESNDDNAQLAYLTYPDNNPVNNFFRTREDHKVSVTMIDILKDREDPRLHIYAMPTESSDAWQDADTYPNGRFPDDVYVGVVNGDVNNSIPLNDASNIGAYFMAPQSPGIIMTFAEVQFILAEAQIRGWITTGQTNKELYDAAVTAAMDLYSGARLSEVLSTFPGDGAYNQQDVHSEEFPGGITSAEITAYLDAGSPAEFPTAGTTQDQLNALAIQKWIAMYGQGLETWSEWRRLGVPGLSPGPLAVLDEVPLRVFFPPDEQSINQANYSSAVQMLGGADNMLTPLWWDQ